MSLDRNILCSTLMGINFLSAFRHALATSAEGTLFGAVNIVDSHSYLLKLSGSFLI